MQMESREIELKIIMYIYILFEQFIITQRGIVLLIRHDINQLDSVILRRRFASITAVLTCGWHGREILYVILLCYNKNWKKYFWRWCMCVTCHHKPCKFVEMEEIIRDIENEIFNKRGFTPSAALAFPHVSCLLGM